MLVALDYPGGKRLLRDVEAADLQQLRTEVAASIKDLPTVTAEVLKMMEFFEAEFQEWFPIEQAELPCAKIRLRINTGVWLVSAPRVSGYCHLFSCLRQLLTEPI